MTTWRFPGTSFRFRVMTMLKITRKAMMPQVTTTYWGTCRGPMVKAILYASSSFKSNRLTSRDKTW